MSFTSRQYIWESLEAEVNVIKITSIWLKYIFDKLYGKTIEIFSRSWCKVWDCQVGVTSNIFPVWAELSFLKTFITRQNWAKAKRNWLHQICCRDSFPWAKESCFQAKYWCSSWDSLDQTNLLWGFPSFARLAESLLGKFSILMGSCCSILLIFSTSKVLGRFSVVIVIWCFNRYFRNILFPVSPLRPNPTPLLHFYKMQWCFLCT